MNRVFTKLRHSEEAFLLASVSEFVKCWSSGKKSRLIIESVNGQAFLNFSAFLGDPKDDHFKARAGGRQPKPKKKSERKIQRDNARAAQFQERKKRETALITSSVSSSTFSSSQVEAAPTSFHFSEPLPENFKRIFIVR